MADVKRSRREKAAQTRARILAAAHEEFLASGFHGATVAAVARRAGVATQTVYFVFHTKAELISAVIDTAVMGQSERPPDQSEEWLAMLAEPDAAQALRLFVRSSAPSFERAAGVALVLAAAALTDDELRARYEGHERLRRAAFRGVVEALAEKAELRGDVAWATDVLLTVLSDATYHALRSDHGWSQDQVVDWLADTLPRLVLAL